MTIIRVVIESKLPDNTTDKELNEIFKRYVDVMPCKKARFRKIPDGWEWLI